MAGLPAEARTKTAREREGGSNSVVESQPSKLLVAGSIPVSRSNLRSLRESRAASFGWQANLRTKAALVGLVSADLSVEARKRTKADPSAEARRAKADVAQLAERVLGKDEVTSSILVIGSNLRSLRELRLASQRVMERRLSTVA